MKTYQRNNTSGRLRVKANNRDGFSVLKENDFEVNSDILHKTKPPDNDADDDEHNMKMPSKKIEQLYSDQERTSLDKETPKSNLSSSQLNKIPNPEGKQLNGQNDQSDPNQTNPSKPYQCPQCNFTTMLRKRLSRHLMDVHASFRTFKCDKCNYAANSRTSVETHIKEVHSSLNDTSTTTTTVKPQKCDIPANPDIKPSKASPFTRQSLRKSREITQSDKDLNGKVIINLQNKQMLPKRRLSNKHDVKADHKNKKRKDDKRTDVARTNEDSSAAKFWTLQRIGYTQKYFRLNHNLPSIIIGRSSKCDMICKGEHISRKHIELKSSFDESVGQDQRICWRILDLKSSGGTYLNGVQLPSCEEVIMKNGDILSIGGNYLENVAFEDVVDNKYMFLYKIRAPTEG